MTSSTKNSTLTSAEVASSSSTSRERRRLLTSQRKRSPESQGLTVISLSWTRLYSWSIKKMMTRVQREGRAKVHTRAPSETSTSFWPKVATKKEVVTKSLVHPLDPRKAPVLWRGLRQMLLRQPRKEDNLLRESSHLISMR